MFQDISDFKRHLADISKGIKVKLEALFARLASHRGQISPKAAELEGKITALLAAQKEFMIRLDRMSSEKEQLSEQLNTATFRYVKAEKRLDRARSVQVQKMEQQAIANATARPSNDQAENGVDEGESNGDNKVLLAQYEEARALVEKQKEQRDAALDQARKLQEELTSVKIRLTGLSDEDYARSDVFKAFKAQNEDLIKRINHLEATNKQLREEAEKFQSERTAFRSQLEREAHAVAMELEDQIQQRDQDLTRIRSARDELFADLSQRKASLEQERTAMEHVRELLAAKEDRIVALELAVERINPTSEPMAQDRPDLDELSLEELRERFIKLELDFDSINKEMPSIEKAYKKAMALSHKKVMDFASLEERVSILIAEKGKADQKYFAARKDMDTRLAEVRALRHQNAKSSEIIQQLKDVEAQSRTLVSNLEKQLTDLKSASSTAMSENRRLEATATESVRKVDSLKQQVENLSGLLKQKDVHNHAITEDKMSVEAELEQLRARIEHVQKDRDSWKTKCQSNSTEEEDLLRVSLNSRCCSSYYDANNHDRNLLYVLFAGATSKTLSSARAATSSARTVSMIGLPTE